MGDFVGEGRGDINEYKIWEFKIILRKVINIVFTICPFLEFSPS